MANLISGGCTKKVLASGSAALNCVLCSVLKCQNKLRIEYGNLKIVFLDLYCSL